MSLLYSIFGFILGFGLVSLTIPPIIRVSIAKHLYDTPNERKASKIVVPTLGGVAIFIGFILSTIIATDGYNFGELKYLIAAIIIMFFIGLKDDLMDISATKKLFVQISTATMLESRPPDSAIAGLRAVASALVAASRRSSAARST